MQFNKVTVKNFLSVGDEPITINLNRHPITLVTGTNGTGKTTVILESIFFALFGVSYRGVKKAELINSTNRGGTSVSLEFVNRHNDTYVVTRCIKPEGFTIEKNGEVLDEEPSAKLQQVALDGITGLVKEQVIQSVMMGSADYRPFLSLSLPERRVFVEKALSLSVYAKAQQEAKAELSSAKTTLNQHKNSFNELKVRYEVTQQAINSQQNQYDSLISSAEIVLKEALDGVSAAKSKFDELPKDLPETTAKISLLAQENQNRDNEVKKLNEIINNDDSGIRNRMRFLEVLEHSDTCSQCKQTIQKDYLDETKTRLDDEIKALVKSRDNLLEDRDILEGKSKDNRLVIEELRGELQTHKDIINEARYKLTSAEGTVFQAETHLNSLKRKKESEGSKVEGASIDEIKQKLKVVADDIRQVESEIKLLTNAVAILGEDGIRKEYVKNILPLLNKEIQDNMLALGAAYSIELTDEFDTVVVGRFAGEFTYQSLSMGERSRCDMAVLLAWLTISENAAGVRSSLLVLDEVGDSSLDFAGQDGLIDLLVKSGKNVFMISHRELNDERIIGKLTFKKVKGFTTLD